jgi:hypothetical protein
MMAFVATENETEKWEGASIDPKSLELYDISGQKLYYEFSVYKENNLISRIDIGANKTLGSALRRIEIDPKPYNVAEVIEKSIKTAKAKYPNGKIVSTNMVVYELIPKLKIATQNPVFQIINQVSDHGSNPENS